MMKNKGIFLTVLSALIYGFTPVLCSITYNYGNNALTLTFFRSLLIIPLLIVLMIVNKIDFKCDHHELLRIIFVGLFGSVFTTLLLYSSYRYIGVGTSTTLHFMYPLFVTLLCHFVFHDKLSKIQIIALGIALSGVFCFIDINDLVKIKGIIMALVSGFTFSLYLVGIEKLNLAKMNNYKLSLYLAITVCVSLFIFGSITDQFVFDQSIISYGLMLVIAFLAQFVAVICLKMGIEYLGSSLASMFSMFEPVSSVVFGCLFLNESITFIKMIGCILILSGVLLLIKK
ncbi:MAG: DMT family transporter [Firmicutes bacterium]|nr:DMT family transporter [Bacillota bacterium]